MSWLKPSHRDWLFATANTGDAGLYPFCLGQPSLSEYLNCCFGNLHCRSSWAELWPVSCYESILKRSDS